jgi:hypothetical protein
MYLGIKDPDAKFNALEYFASQLDNIQSNNLKGNKYANYLIPEFKKSIYVLQNLETYGKSNGPMARPGAVSRPRPDAVLPGPPGSPGGPVILSGRAVS